LGSPDVFYFGNAVGETGNRPYNAQVNASDEALVRFNGHSAFDPVDITFPYDFNRDRLVNSSDQAILRLNVTSALTALQWISPPLGVAAAASASSAGNAAVDCGWDSAFLASRRRRLAS
jgi:hypothetical protein